MWLDHADISPYFPVIHRRVRVRPGYHTEYKWGRVPAKLAVGAVLVVCVIQNMSPTNMVRSRQHVACDGIRATWIKEHDSAAVSSLCFRTAHPIDGIVRPARMSQRMSGQQQAVVIPISWTEIVSGLVRAAHVFGSARFAHSTVRA